MNKEIFQAYDANKYLNLSDVSSSTAQGSSVPNVYSNQKIQYSGALNDAAKARLIALSAVEESKMSAGMYQYLARYRDIYADNLTFSTGELTSTAVEEYNTNHKLGQVIIPTQVAVGTAIQWNAERTNMNELMADKQLELSYALATRIEQFILQNETYGILSADIANSTSRGASVLYGGGGTDDSDIAAGEVLTYSKIVDGKTRISSIRQYYWVGGVEGISAQGKNPWANEPTDPFVLIVGPEQEANLLKDTQFSTFEKYGGQEPLLNGEIGKISNVKVVVSQYIPRKAVGEAGWDASGNAAVNLTRCILMKGRAAYNFVWGKEPSFDLDKEIMYTKDTMVLWTTYSGAVVHDDAICFIDVADI